MKKWNGQNLGDLNLSLVPTNQWDQSNLRLQKKISLESDQTLRIYQDLASAIFETAFGTTHLLAHKRSVAILKGMTNSFDFVTAHFYKQLLNVQLASFFDFKGKEDVAAWVDGLKKDTSFVLFAEDHPVTGALFPFIEELDQILNEKKIFSIRVSHSAWRYRNFSTTELRPYSVQIRVYGNKCLAYCGERFKSPSLLVHVQSWSEADLADFKNTFLSQENQTQIQEFEAQLLDISKKYFSNDFRWSPQAPRLWDRAVVVLKDVSAAALIELLAERNSLLPLEVPLLAVNECLTGHQRSYKGWWEPAPTEEVLVSLLVVPELMIAQKDFASEFRAAYEELYQLSHWS